ncbi:TonB-dependent receptor [Neolewinella lacunae]|uniref:TonB-dependent receptor n=1 Tax=Neolewinella lacunae TaxID=1517758 RepID=A0A923PL69_9BACT|nr:TonB-dependent receptor [Neolewinella lacunae]MBC6996107.1 TonB-dependent receptor [Neolewinella lacunae]MDN3633961.1 TonB-dependent receptor [Neolewinella lacunae]
MVLRILVTGLLLGWAGRVGAQTIHITDELTSLPLEGVLLVSQNPPATTITDAKGEAGLQDFTMAEAISIRSFGYATVTTSYQQLLAAEFRLALVPTALHIDQIVVSATRWQRPASRTPATVLSISPETVALQQAQTAADLLGLSGKVFIQKSQQGGGSPMIRGFSANRLLYAVDGVRMNTAIFRGGNLQNVINLDPFAIENTEVLFGPGSVGYGSDAIGGVMSFQTLTPQLATTPGLHLTGKATLRHATANRERTGHLDLNLGWEKWAFVTSFSSWDFDHLRQGANGPTDYLKTVFVQRQAGTDRVIEQDDPLLQIPSAYGQRNFMQKVRFVPRKDWTLDYAYHHSTTTPYGRYDRHNRFRNGQPRYAEWDYGPQQWSMHHLSASHRRQSALYDAATVRLARQDFAESRIDRNLNQSIRNTQSEAVVAYSFNLDFNKAFGPQHELAYGAEYVHNDVRSTGLLTDIVTTAEQPGAARYPAATWQSLAAFATHTYRPSGPWTLQAALRYNVFRLAADFNNNSDFFPLPFRTSQQQDGALTGSFGAVFRPAEKWILRANLGSAFRAPNVDDTGKVFDSEPGAVTVPNPNLAAEYAWNLDFGVAKLFGESVKVELLAYHTRLQNALVRRNFQLNGRDSILYQGELSQVQAIQNAALARVWGLQLGFEVQLPAGFRFLTDLNYQEGEEELDDGTTSASRHAAPAFGITRLRYTSKRTTLEINASYQAERSFARLAQEERAKDEIYAKDAAGNNYAPAWYTLNFKAQYRFSKAFHLSVGLENLTDQRYRPYSSGISGAGRNGLLALSLYF